MAYRNFCSKILLLSGIALTLTATSGCTNNDDPADDGTDDKTIYYQINEDTYWEYEASTVRNLDYAKVPYNIDFACTPLQFGYYRAIVTLTDAQANTLYSLFTLDNDFNVVAFFSDSGAFTANRTASGYELSDAHEFELPWDYPDKDEKVMSRSAEDYAVRVAQALLDFHPYCREYSKTEGVNWDIVLKAVVGGSVKPLSSAPLDWTSLSGAALLGYEADRRASGGVVYVAAESLHSITPILQGVETVGDKLTAHLTFETESWTKESDFSEVMCGLVLYDYYDAGKNFPQWLEPKPVSGHECEIVYDNLPEAKEYYITPYIINKKYVKSTDPMVMNGDMAFMGTYDVAVHIMPANTLTITKVFENMNYMTNGSDMECVRVQGHVSCDISDSESSWEIDYFWLPEGYETYGPKFPGAISPAYRYTGIYVPGRREYDFDLRIPIDQDKVYISPKTGKKTASVMLFIAYGPLGNGSYTIIDWTYPD